MARPGSIYMDNLPAHQNRRVLIIDDNRAIHEDFRKILSPAAALTTAEMDSTEATLFGNSARAVRQIPFEVDSAYQGQEGVALVQQALEAGRPYALAFVDVQMPPGWGGVETTRKIWELDADLQVVLCTAYSDYAWDDMFEKLGHQDGLLILKKPFDPVEALQLAHALTEKWRLHQQSRRKMEDLESLVAGRTRELQQTNEILQKEVADHKRAEETLRESEERFAGAFEHAPIGVALVSPDGRWLKVNRALCDLVGYSEAELLTGTFQDVTHPEDLAASLENVRRLRAGEIDSYQMEKRYVHRHGHIICASLNVSVVRDSEGQPHYCIAQIQDITERERAEETLRLLSSAVEQSRESILITDAELDWPGPRIVFVNPAFTQMTGYTALEVIGQTPRILQGPRTDKAVVRRLRECLNRGEGFEGETINYRKSGQEFDIEWQAVPLRQASGKITHFVAIQRDITQRKLVENALRESHEKFNQLANNITDAFWIRSSDLREVHYISPAFERIWGRSVESLYANPHQWPDFILPEDRERVLAGFATFTGDAPNLAIEYRIVRPDGEIRWVYLRASQVRDGEGNVIRITGIVTDTTERKQVEAQLFQSQKMETVGKLAGGIAHEFNSILTAILGQSELLLTNLPADSPLTKNATEISTAAGRVATLTRQLLAYGRKQFLRPEILDLNQVIAGMEGMFRHLMGGEVNVLIAPAHDLHRVKVDAGQIEQVIVNMAINARDAMPNGGKLTLETANVSLDAESVSNYPELKPGDYVMLAITDTGIGMSEAVKARVFEPFFTTKEIGQGTGLGLSTCYGIIKQSGGHISVYSELARGTTFKVYLPQAEPVKNVLAGRSNSPGLPRGTETILLVEDDPALREMATSLLRRLGYTVHAAANGLEALSLKQQPNIGSIDLLFTDVVMPHMSGQELAERMQNLNPEIRILFTSAYTENAIVHQGMLNQGTALLQKPFTPAALANKLREVLGK